MFVKMARQQSRLFAAAYGHEHLQERLEAVDRLNDIRDECPEFFTASFLSETWERMVHQYNACVSEGVHYILGMYDEGITFEKVRRYALAPNSKNQTAWQFTPIFDFDHPDGFWRSVILVEIYQERQRQDINSLVAARGKPIGERKNTKTSELEEKRRKPKLRTLPVQTLLQLSGKAVTRTNLWIRTEWRCAIILVLIPDAFVVITVGSLMRNG